MRICAFFTMACCCMYVSTAGKIINGYDKDISSARASYAHLKTLRPEKTVTRRLTVITEYIVYYELTKVLLQQFQSISPSLYREIDTLTDKKGRPVNVYVKFIPRERGVEGTVATTNINQQVGDEHGYLSEYGPQTVSVQIFAVKHSLRILAHEFGHVSYQVAHLASYADFFSRNYSSLHMKATYLGHKPNDPSGQRAEAFERRFKADLQEYCRSINGIPHNPVLLLNQIARTFPEKI